MFIPTARRTWTVRELVAAVRTNVEREYGDIWVEGEISNFKAHESGHLYFTLKDASAQMRVVMFRPSAKLLRFRPEWFAVLNTDFRYQLTVIGQFAQAIIGREIESNRFEIRTNAPNVKVSWQVTGVRQDAYAKANPLVVEQEKDARLRGFYIHPELYGAPREKQIEWARHPQMMKQIQDMRARQLATRATL